MPAQVQDDRHPRQINRRRELWLGALIWGTFWVVALVALWALGVSVDGDW
jgi:hypothetical protein